MQQLIWKPRDANVQSPWEWPTDGDLRCAWSSERVTAVWVVEGNFKQVDSHSILDFLSGQTRVNFSSHKGYLPAFEELITHEVDKLKLYLLPGRLAAS